MLKTFVTIVDTGSFTATAEQLHIAQSTVSAHMRRLEESFGCQLLLRSQSAATPTSPGERLVAHARQMLRQNALAWQDVLKERLDGIVRLGIPEDYVVYLPAALSAFEARFPSVELEVICGLSVDLVQDVKAGALDLAITTRQPNSPGGQVLRREPTIWAGAASYNTHTRSPLPLAVSKEGVCIFRERAISALDASGIAWRIAYASASLSGLSAAVRAGLAVTVITPSMMSSHLQVLGAEEGLPLLPDTEITLHRRPSHTSEAANQLAIQLQRHFE